MADWRAGSPEFKPSDLTLDEAVAATLAAHLPDVAAKTIVAVTMEVPGYSGTLEEYEQANLEQAVEFALRGFLSLASRVKDSDPSTPLAPLLEAARSLGRGEARRGRSMDALLAAYRVGARVAWRELATAAVDRGVDASTLVSFAELVFAYIDRLSAASVAGHATELATSDRIRQRHLERLAQGLVAGESADFLIAAAERADWEPPPHLIAVVLGEPQLAAAVGRLDPRTLQVSDAPGLGADGVVLLVPDLGSGSRSRLFDVLSDVPAVVGPSRPWTQVCSSFQRALRARRLGIGAAHALDTEQYLPELVVGADLEALADLRAGVLAPIREQSPAVAERLRQTLRSWLLHQGRREDVAADLFIHPQTVRYRMAQLRELYGEQLKDPRTMLELTIALGPG